MKVSKFVQLGACATIGAMSVCAAFSKDLTTSGPMSTASMQDIINTLRSKGSFHKMLQGLEQTYELDNSKVKTPDIKCSNGIIHIVDAPLMPPLKK